MSVRPGLARLARSLTFLRMLATPLFAWAFVRLESVPDARRPAWLLLAIYGYAVLSDLLDGPLARRAGAASYRWGQADALADVAFNAAALAAAAWAGRVGPWVPLGVLALGARFLWRCRRRAVEAAGALPEDAAGKRAGVLFYLLVGAVVLEAGFPAARLGAAVDWLGHLVFLYTAYLLLWGWRPPRAGRLR